MPFSAFSRSFEKKYNDVKKLFVVFPIMDFGELKNDKTFIQTVLKFSQHLDEIDKNISDAVNFNGFDELSTEEKVKYDSYLSYTINSLYWMYVKLQGTDPNEHGVKNELSRIRQSMLRDKQIYERKTMRPILDKGATKRFVKHALHIRFEENKEDDTDNLKTTSAPINKKIRFDNGKKDNESG